MFVTSIWQRHVPQSIPTKIQNYSKRTSWAVMSSVLVVGATRGLGASLVKQHVARGNTVYGTMRSTSNPEGFPTQVKWLPGIDLTDPQVGEKLVASLGAEPRPLAELVSDQRYETGASSEF